MNLLGPSSWRMALALVAWLLLLVILPWWLGLSLLLAVAAMLLLLQARLLGEHARKLRWGLRWGLPGMLLSLQRALGGDALAWIIVLLGALAGYMLIVGLELWLDRAAVHEPQASEGARAGLPAAATAEWPVQLMSSAIGPPAELIELEVPQWRDAGEDLSDPWGGHARYGDGGYVFAGDRRIDGVEGQACFSPDGRWFAAPIARAKGVLLWDRRQDWEHRLHGWLLAGWYSEQPWLQRRVEAPPCTLQQVLGADDPPTDDMG